MSNMLHKLRVTVVGGALFLIPIVLLILILGKALDLLRTVVNPLAEQLPIESLIGLETPKFLAIFLLILLFFIAGLFAKTNMAKNFVNRLETAILSNLPGYSFLKNIGEEAAGEGTTHQYQTVLARFDDAWQIGYLVERMEGGRIVVYIPDSPKPWSGGVFIFDEDRITLIDEATNVSVKVLQKLGAGTTELVKGKL